MGILEIYLAGDVTVTDNSPITEILLTRRTRARLAYEFLMPRCRNLGEHSSPKLGKFLGISHSATIL
jgi:hypothetical protein